MSKLRAFLIALTILAMAVAPMLIPGIAQETASGARAYAAVAAAPVNADDDDDDDDDDNNDDDDDDDNDNNGGDDDDDDDNDNNGDDDDDDDNDDNDNGGDDDDDDDDDSGDNDNDSTVGSPPVQTAAPAAPSASSSSCSTPGQEMSFQSDDGRITVKVFGSMAQSLKFSIRTPIDPASVPPAPGPIVGGLLFQLIAETCDGGPVPVLPAEVNLGVRYEDGDIGGLNEANFTLARLDTSANQWRPAQKQATDPGANYTSATITEMGFYVLYPK